MSALRLHSRSLDKNQIHHLLYEQVIWLNTRTELVPLLGQDYLLAESEAIGPYLISVNDLGIMLLTQVPDKKVFTL